MGPLIFSMALPAMKPLRVMSLMVFSLALPGGPLRPLFKLQLSQWEGGRNMPPHNRQV